MRKMRKNTITMMTHEAVLMMMMMMMMMMMNLLSRNVMLCVLTKTRWQFQKDGY